MSMSTSEENGLRSLTLDKEEDDVPQHDKTLEDLPPEVMTEILEWLTVDETRNNVLSYRLVNHQWKDILDDLIEKKLKSGRLQPFPAMKIGGESELLQVRCSPTVFRADGDPFPFNSVLLSGNAELTLSPRSLSDIQKDLPVFVSEFGRNLTSLALHDLKIPVGTLVAMIGSLPRLKHLSLLNVRQEDSVIKPDAVLPTLPPLPNLAVLEVKSVFKPPVKPFKPLKLRAMGVHNERNVLDIWLIASYADQLVRLNLAGDSLFPALRIQHQYSVFLPKNKMFRIATTSESAFGNLKELHVFDPTCDFILKCETLPALQQLSVTCLDDFAIDFDMRDVGDFCVKLGDTLKKLILDIPWKVLEPSRSNYFPGQLRSTEGIIVPKLKTLVIHYPSKIFQERILSEELLVMIPALEVLHLLHFKPHDFDNESPFQGGNEEGGTDDDIVTVKGGVPYFGSN